MSSALPGFTVKSNGTVMLLFVATLITHAVAVDGTVTLLMLMYWVSLAFADTLVGSLEDTLMWSVPVALPQSDGLAVPLMLIVTTAPDTSNPLGNVMLYHDVVFVVSFIVKFVHTLVAPATLALSSTVAVTPPTVFVEVSALTIIAIPTATSTSTAINILFVRLIMS